MPWTSAPAIPSRAPARSWFGTLPAPVVPTPQHQVGWFPEPPVEEPREPQLAWWSRHYRTAADQGVGVDLATLVAAYLAAEQAAGADASTSTGVYPWEQATGADLALTRALLVDLDHGCGLGADLARPGVRPTEQGVGADAVVNLVRQVVNLDTAVGNDLASLIARMEMGDWGVGNDLVNLVGLYGTESATGADLVTSIGLPVWSQALGTDSASAQWRTDAWEQALGQESALCQPRIVEFDNGSGCGQDSATGVFTPQAPIGPNAYTANANVAIPPWVRYIDGIALGAGGGGAGGNRTGGSGKGGNAGQWAMWTWDRGPSRNTWTVINLVIGNGGNGGSRNTNGSGSPGGATTITIHGDTMTANGGTGGSGIAGAFTSERDGKSPGSVNHQGVGYNGGSGNSNEPGSGGEGGGGSTWPLNSGSGQTGAKGRAWLSFRM